MDEKKQAPGLVPEDIDVRLPGVTTAALAIEKTRREDAIEARFSAAQIKRINKWCGKHGTDRFAVMLQIIEATAEAGAGGIAAYMKTRGI